MQLRIATCAAVLYQTAHSATYELVSQVRTISAGSFFESDFEGDSDSAPDFGPFDASVDVGASDASQNSFFEPRFMFAQGDVHAHACASSGFYASAYAHSIFDVDFTISHPTRWRIFSEPIFGGGFGAPGSVTLTKKQVVLFSCTHSSDCEGEGAITPGQYKIRAHAQAQSMDVPRFPCGEFSYGEFNVQFELRRFGDANGDSAVNMQDALAVISQWGACPADDCQGEVDGDLNNDGNVGINDLLEVVEQWD